jgi:hypothetical protein
MTAVSIAELFESVTLIVVLVIALRPQTPKHVRGGWSHYTDTSEPTDGNKVKNMVTVESRFQTSDLFITCPTGLPSVLTGPTVTLMWVTCLQVWR